MAKVQGTQPAPSNFRCAPCSDGFHAEVVGISLGGVMALAGNSSASPAVDRSSGCFREFDRRLIDLNPSPQRSLVEYDFFPQQRALGELCTRAGRAASQCVIRATSSLQAPARGLLATSPNIIVGLAMPLAAAAARPPTGGIPAI